MVNGPPTECLNSSSNAFANPPAEHLITAEEQLIASSTLQVVNPENCLVCEYFKDQYPEALTDPGVQAAKKKLHEIQQTAASAGSLVVIIHAEPINIYSQCG